MQHSTHICFPLPQTKKLCKLKSYATLTFVGSYAGAQMEAYVPYVEIFERYESNEQTVK